MLESLLNKVAGPYEIFKNTYLEEHLRTTAFVTALRCYVVSQSTNISFSCDTGSESRKLENEWEFVDLKLKISFCFIFV